MNKHCKKMPMVVISVSQIVTVTVQFTITENMQWNSLSATDFTIYFTTVYSEGILGLRLRTTTWYWAKM